jgi:hypothetical protein
MTGHIQYVRNVETKLCNLRAFRETYFVVEHIEISVNSPKLAPGYAIMSLENGEWHIVKNMHYRYDDLYDEEHFKVVGQVDIDNEVKNLILTAINSTNKT